MIKLNEILGIEKENLKNCKIRFMVAPSNDRNNNPLDLYKLDPLNVTNKWLLWKQAGQGNPFQEGQIAIGFLSLYNDRWLLVTIKNITRVLNNQESGINYEADVLPKFAGLYGRLIVKYHNNSQQMIKKAETIMDSLEVLEILPDNFDDDEFPGYENVRITWSKLNRLIERSKADWNTALKNQKGVYLITDTKTGKMYVGSATGENMIWQRWKSYAENGHGGNIELRALEFDYIKKNFQYSILDIYNNKTDDKIIIQREIWWKETLLSRVFGYNCN